ncbi:MAG: hypothetical protein FWB74_10370 [Defluviitaleaceae bacterium]|nr:hypothetical protein [Defluviitaleaceae bacterium]
MKKDLTVVIVLGLIIGGLSLINLFFTPPDILLSERRLREQRPALSLDSLTSGDFMADFEPYAADAFPFRDTFRALRAAATFGAFLQTDKDGIYFEQTGIGSFAATNAESVALLADKIAAIANGLEGLNIFYAIIPDKSIFANRTMPGFDNALVEQIKTERLPHLQFIPLIDALTAQSFYRTDLHWNQVRIGEVADALGNTMDFTVNHDNFTKHYAGQFHGGYAGQFALPVRTESMYFLHNPYIRAFYMNMATREFEEGEVHDLSMFGGLDPYDIFLRGIQPLVKLTNENAATYRTLYIFRDSFASSLAPILADAYAKIFLIDFRFIDLRTVHEILDFAPGSDALFLYSGGILNNAEMLMIPMP